MTPSVATSKKLVTWWGDHGGKSRQQRYYEPAGAAAGVLRRGEPPDGQHGEPKERHRQRLIDEHRVEGLEERLAGIQEHRHASDPVRGADVAEKHEQHANEQQVSGAGHDQPGDEDREPGDGGQSRGDFLEAGVVRADRQQVVNGEELACLQDVRHAAPVHEFVGVGEGRRTVTDLDEVLRYHQNHDERQGLATREDAPTQQPGRYRDQDEQLAEPVQVVGPRCAGVPLAPSGVGGGHHQNAHRSAEGHDAHRQA